MHTVEDEIKSRKSELHPTVGSDKYVPRKELGDAQHQAIEPAGKVLKYESLRVAYVPCLLVHSCVHYCVNCTKKGKNCT
jgi:hypothetical protein